MSGTRVARRVVLALVPAVLASACGRPATETVQHVQVVVTPRLASAPFYIGRADGHFARHGFDVELIEMTRSVDAMAALGQGRFDVSGGAINAGLLNAMARGVPIRIVAGTGFARPGGCTAYAVVGAEPWASDLLARRTTPLRVSADPTQFTGFMLDRHLAGAGRSLADVVIEDVAEPVELQALRQGQIDAVAAGEPWLSRIVSSGTSHVWARIEELLPDAQVGSMWFGPTFLEENRDAGGRFMAAYLDAVGQYEEGPTPRNLEIVSGYTGIDVEQLAATCWTPIRRDGRVNVESVREFRAWLARNGHLEKSEEPVRDEDMVDTSFTDWANARRGR
jgi:NitT/TauT family transport system substrate-binding protein